MTIKFEYGTSKVKDIKVKITKGLTKKNKNVVSQVLINDEPLIPTKRFWKSLNMRFKINDTVFKYFTHEEVFNRIADVSAHSVLRYCLERVDGSPVKLLAVTSPSSPYIECDDLMEIISQYNSENMQYSGGLVRSTHVPKIPWHTQIGGDAFVNRFIADIPIDGFGKPAMYVSLIRQVCTNGAIGFSPAFRTELNVGKKDDSIEYVLRRALESFNNEDGYTDMYQRFVDATNSWASVNEAMSLSKVLIKVYNNSDLKGVKKITIGEDTGNTWDDVPIMKKFSELTGNLNHTYGLSNIDALSGKKQRTLPAGCKVYDLLNFCSEVATHHSTPNGNRVLQAWLGTQISNEYDLENTVKEYADWKDFFIHNDKAIQTQSELSTLSHS